MKPLRIVFLVVGSVCSLVGLAFLVGGAGLGAALATQRDDAGFFTTANERFHSPTSAITTEEIDLGSPGPDEWWADRELATARFRAKSADGSPVFIGIGPETDVERYLNRVPHDEITDVDVDPFSATYRRHNARGRATPAPPSDQTFWSASKTGTATQTLTWNLRPGRWAVVVMNADGHRPVAADIDVGAKIKYLVPLALGAAGAGLLLLILGAGLILGGVVGRHPPAETDAGVGVAAEPAGRRTPVRLEGQLDPVLSRWQWLVKWFLAIPHFIVLVLLWIAFGVLTIVAFFAILFTGRYPRSIFEFNVGVLRWTWRVGFYATSVLGTDRYPPFTLAAVDYPATLDIAYPEHLSRGLVLVKSWLLALPHLAIVGLLTGGAPASASDSTWGSGMSLVGLLLIIAAITLLFTRRYPRGLFDFLMGIHRWTYRVIAYVALMTDEYPPFRLDQGSTEPRASERLDSDPAK